MPWTKAARREHRRACPRYASDMTDREWALVAPYLALLPEGAGQRGHPLREAFNGLRYVVRYARRGV